jgi:hypothetical protein
MSTGAVAHAGGNVDARGREDGRGADASAAERSYRMGAGGRQSGWFG